MTIIKNIILSVVFILVVYSVFGGYIFSMFNSLLYGQSMSEPKPQCAIFDGGVKYSISSVNAIDLYADKTGKEYIVDDCNWNK